MRTLTILGSTGSIGTQALDVVDLHPNRFRVVALSAHQNSELLFEQVRRYRPLAAALSAGEVRVPDDLKDCQWYFGNSAMAQLAAHVPCTDVLVAVSGMVGLASVLAARKAGKRVLLANKEALVAGGQLVMDQCSVLSEQPTLLPVDSEHSALWQCLQGAGDKAFRRLILTASGGPFRTWSRQSMREATVEQALKHPNWSMGAKITVDSASMFNKALEVIEARWLFDAQPEQIEVLIHPSSMVHSMVEFEDGALLAQLGLPDMRIPIQYAMSYPQRLRSNLPPVQAADFATLHFEQPDTQRFPSLNLAYDALNAGGTAACILNAANEVAVAAFLDERITFGAIFDAVHATMQKVVYTAADSLEAVEEADRAAREACALVIKAFKH